MICLGALGDNRVGKLVWLTEENRVSFVDPRDGTKPHGIVLSIVGGGSICNVYPTDGTNISGKTDFVDIITSEDTVPGRLDKFIPFRSIEV